MAAVNARSRYRVKVASRRIFSRAKHIRITVAEHSSCHFSDGEEVPFQGENFGLRVVEGNEKRTTVWLMGNCFWVRINRGIPSEIRTAEIQGKMVQLYRSLAREAITERAEFFKKCLGVDYNQIRIKEQKTRWGSCSRKANLNFNWRLVIAPSDVIDYVVVHELCHLLHMNHSKEFWHTVEALLPDYRRSKRWLKENGWKLHL